MSITTILFSAFGICLLLGAPVAISLGIATMFALLMSNVNLVYLVQVAYSSVDSFPLMALPSFVLAGFLMEYAGVSRRLVALAEALAGPATGGLAGATVLGCLFFGAISGSGPATTAAVGMLMIPAMIARNYDRSFAGAITASAGGLGVVIPPSIPMVIYGVSGNQSITTLFIAGFIPGMMIAGMIMVVNYFICRRKGYVGTEAAWSGRLILQRVREGFWSILAPFIILGGIYTGFFTPTEAAVVAIFYTLFVGFFIHGELKLPRITQSLSATGEITGTVLIIMFTARSFGRLIVEHRIPEILANAMLSLTTNLTVIWLILIALFIFIGMWMETLATIMLLTPILLPIMTKLGVDPIHFGIVLVVACEIGFETPPLGENLFIGARIANVSLEEISLSSIPFAITEIVCLITIALIPQISMILPRLIQG
ncbi:MAG: TRAP transporter large permease [Deltaproteobacteria bacterium]|nr:TRAP transporter large permease [Deltaproteobacteria bacterium]MBW2307203.1 TRAP transporter large permease [Deltaproteobacteria bacterium]